MKPRDYQKDAAKIAREKERSVFVLPTGTGKTFIGLLWLDSLFKDKKIKKALVLEPTRILVEQVYKFYKMLGMEVTKIYGVIPKERRRELWKKSKIVITTPETAYNDREYSREFDAVVVDEAHHSVGDDFYAKFLKESEARYRLGLSAFIPRKKRKEIEDYIGEIIEWGYEDKRIRKYIPNFLIDIFESPFYEREMKLYESFEKNSREDVKDRILWKLAMRFFSRDGALALRDSLNRDTKLSRLLEKYKSEIFSVRELHKLGSLFEILETFEFKKAIIFVDRVVVARKLLELLKDENAVLILGRRKKEEIKESLEEARKEETRYIISTSAGEEGLDLPTADLLINWSNVVNPVRFIQRYGRVLRKTTNLKFITHIVTPNTVDVDAFLKCLAYSMNYINLGMELFDHALKISEKREIIEILKDPMPLDVLSKYFSTPESEIRKILKVLMEKGDVIYFYTFEKLYIRKDSIENAILEYPDYFSPDIDSLKVVGKEFKSFKASFEGAFKRLKKKLPVRGIRFIWRREREGIEEIYYKSYDFLIRDEAVLEFVLKNAYTSKIYI